MNFIYFFVRVIWSRLRARAMYAWWIIKYRGKKNIPPEIIFAQMTKKMQRLQERLQTIFRDHSHRMPPRASRRLLKIMAQSNALEGKMKNLGEKIQTLRARRQSKIESHG